MSEQRKVRLDLRQSFCDIVTRQKNFFDLGTSFISELVHNLTKLLEIQLEHASLKHPQTVGFVERSHRAVKRILKLTTNEQWNNWCKCVQLATLIHNTSYHSAIGCSPAVSFDMR